MPLNTHNRSLSGPSRTPTKTLLKKFAYTESIQLNNTTSSYSYYSTYAIPDVTKAIGSGIQFAAYELWRLKKMKVSIQMANSAGSTISPLNAVPSTTVWTAADLSANETISGASIMQYQNAKRNTVSFNKWTKIVDTACRINLPGNANFIMPASTWVRTDLVSTTPYSGYQMFIQLFGAQNNGVKDQPSYTIQTELEVEFMQPAFQNNASTFSSRAFNIRMVTQPDSSDPSVKRTYVFNRYYVRANSITGVREFTIVLSREDGLPGTLTYSGAELRTAIQSGTSTPYFGGRPIVYDGPTPPTAIPDIDYEISTTTN